MKVMRSYIYAHFFKRLLDVVFSLLLLICMSPLLVLITLLIKINIGGRALTSSELVGEDGGLFAMYMFQTGREGEPGESFGRALRTSGLHELPMLFNIVMGQMSFIGPRPLPREDMLFMNSQQALRFKVKPGLTGWARVNGGRNLDWEESLTYDQHYVASLSFRMDVSTLLMTLASGVKQETVSTGEEGHTERYGEYLLRTGNIDEDIYRQTLEHNTDAQDPA
ncbi:MAG: sugar transferase [Spirochaetota bacterium]